jgi:hypothetical protein
MIERVAMVLRPGNGCIRNYPCEFCDDGPGDIDRDGAGCRHQARAAIEAMREPTEAMVGIHSLPYCPAEMREYWHAMIDAALGLVK